MHAAVGEKQNINLTQEFSLHIAVMTVQLGMHIVSIVTQMTKE